MNQNSVSSSELNRLLKRCYPNYNIQVLGEPWPELDRPIEPTKSTLYLINDLLGELEDVWLYLRQLKQQMSPNDRVLLLHVSWYWKPALSKKGETITTWFSHGDIDNLLALNGFEIISYENRILCPFSIPFIEPFLNRWVAGLPFINKLCHLRLFHIAHDPCFTDRSSLSPQEVSVSVIIPARDERENIAACFNEVPIMGEFTELIFIEGGSTDGTYEEIVKQNTSYKGPHRIQILKQTDKSGKGGAVRLGYDKAQGDLLMILDSDLSVAPNDLYKFYLAFIEKRAEYVQGSRLVYPMEKGAMRFLNILGNKFFSISLSWILNQPLKDTLCGTKVIAKSNYEELKRAKYIFGDFDPFGDFDLIFGAARMNLKIREIPIRYKSRTYGTTKISRFSHGWLLLKMTALAYKFFKIG